MKSFLLAVGAAVFLVWAIVKPWCEIFDAPQWVAVAASIVTGGLCGWFIPMLYDDYRGDR